MAKNAYVKGRQVVVSATITLVSSGALTDPTTVVCTVTKPDGTTATPAVTHDSTGKYHSVVDTSSGPQGDWQYLFQDTGAVLDANYGVFWVDDPAFK
jgi:hypothetical protein